jgi:NADPH2:quinone reductase
MVRRHTDSSGATLAAIERVKDLGELFLKAIVCHSYGPPDTLRHEDFPRSAAGPGQVLVQMHAIGVNFTDLLAIEGRSQLQRVLPMIPGVEGAGMVTEVGAGVLNFRPGQRVLGCRAHGCYAEEVLFVPDELSLIPDQMDMHSAAAFYIAAFSARYALQDRAKLRQGENLLVLGAGGGVGLAAIDIGKALGARVVAAASSDHKLALAKAHGADALLRYAAGPLDLAAQKVFAADLLALAERSEATPLPIGAIKTVHANAGYHVILDGVGGSYAEPALRALGWEGRYLSIGFAAGMAKVALGSLLFKNADIMGIQPSSDEARLPGRNLAAMQRMFGWFLQGRLRPQITAVLPLAEAATALRMLTTARGAQAQP